MKKLLTIISIIMMLGLFVNAWSLAPEYTFTQGSGTYTSPATLAGFPVLVASDDGTSAALAIGFNFLYDGTTFTQFIANANGSIRLGTVSTTNAYSPLSDVNDTGVIVPMARDGRSSGGVIVETQGSAPNRVCVIEYLNWDLSYSYTTTRVTMQIQLAETTNTVKFVYGSSVSIASYSPYVGLRGMTTGATDFSTRTGSDWAATTAGTSTSSMTWSTTSYPASGQYYMWTPPVAGTVPNPAALVSPLDGATGVSQTPTLTWASGGGLPTSYDVYFGTSPTPAFIGNQLGTTYAPGTLVYDQLYYWQIVPRNGIGPAVGCPVWSFTVMTDPTITVFPYTMDFETWPPLNWTLTGGTFPWILHTDATPNNWAEANFWSQTSGNTDKLTTPPIHPTVDSRVRFTWSHAYSSSYPLDGMVVQISNNGTDWTSLWAKAGTDLNSADGAGNTVPGTGVSETIVLPGSYTNTTFYIQFLGNSGYGPDLYVDNVIIEALPAGAPAAPLLATPVNGALSQPVAGPVLNWAINPAGGPVEWFTVYVSNDDTDPYQNAYEVGTNVSYDLATSGLTFGYDTIWYWTISANGAGTEEFSETRWFKTQAEGVVAIGEGTAISYIPVYPYYTYTYSQSIYLQSEINVAGRQFETLSWYWNGNEAFDEPNIDIYMGHTSATDLTTDYLPVSAMTLVYSGPYSVPATAGWVEFTLNTPFIYNNVDNLVIAVNENGGPANTYYSSSSGFRVSTVGTSRSRYIYQDSAPYDPTAVLTGTTLLTVPNIMLTSGVAPTTPVFSILPDAWDFGNVDELNPVTKQFIITNAGIGTLTIPVGGVSIYNTVPGGGETNFFTISSEFVDLLPISLGQGESVPFIAHFTPQTIGVKNGTLEITHNGPGGVTAVALTGTGVTESFGDSVILAGALDGNNVDLNWARFNFDGSLNWDSGTNSQGIGMTGGGTFNVAAKFDTIILSQYAGQYLSTIRMFPSQAATTFTLKVWSGDDGVLTPTTELYSQVITPTVAAWNDFVIPGILITGTESLWIGYESTHADAVFPAGCDAGPAIPNYGDLIQMSGGAWQALSLISTLNYNWNIQGMVTAAPAPGRTIGQLHRIPVPQYAENMNARPEFSADPRNNPTQPSQRALQGYRVWRDGVDITPVLVTGTYYRDSERPVGTYNYQVEAVYYTGNVMSNIIPMTVPEITTPTFEIVMNAGLPALVWDPIPGANSYYIYWDTDPNGTYSNAIFVAGSASYYYLLDGLDPFNFYKITASTDMVVPVPGPPAYRGRN